MQCDTKAIVETLNTAVLITDNALKIVFANAAAEQLLGMSRTRLYTLKFNDLIDKEEKTLLNFLNETNLKLSFQGFIASGILLSPEPGRSIEVSLSLNGYPSKRGGIIIEISSQPQQEKLMAEQRLRDQHDAARNLIRSLAHEIKNPLGGIRGAAQLVEMSYSKIDGITDYTQVIIEQTDRLTALVDKLLGPQRPNPLTLVNIHFVIEKVLSLVNMQPLGDIRIEKDYDPSLPELCLDIDAMQQVLLNIINNAVQALNQGHPPYPAIKIKTRASIHTIINNVRYPISIVVSICNNGPQIPENLLHRIFYPMVTTKNDGNGLGLSIAQSVVERHGGALECTSDNLQTCFKIILPLTTAKNQREEQ